MATRRPPDRSSWPTCRTSRAPGPATRWYSRHSPALLAKFPPTLLITGSRDFTLSSVLHSQALLAAAGVDTELHVWDGMWHSFFSDPEMPESREAYAVMVRFFDRRLGH